MEKSSEFQYKMKDSWNPCDVTFFTQAGVRSLSGGRIGRDEKNPHRIFLMLSGFMGNPGTGDRRMEFLPGFVPTREGPEEVTF